MKRVFGYGIAVLALTAAPAFAQTSPAGGTNGTTQGRTQGGSTTGTQSGSSGTATGSQSGTRSGSQSGTETSARSSGQQSTDHEFVMEAARGGMAEVELGQLASQKAQSEQVKQFAQRMVTDHGKANDELKSIAQQKSITIPSTLDAKHKAKMDKFSKMSGAEFDRAYMQDMLQDHRKDVNDFRKESQSGKDPEVKAWAAKTLPTLEEHLRLAQSASGAVGTSGSKSGSTTGSTGRTGATSGQGSSGSGSSSSGGSSGSGTSSGSGGRTGGSSGTPGSTPSGTNNPR
jgi:putative membrane protein